MTQLPTVPHPLDATDEIDQTENVDEARLARPLFSSTEDTDVLPCTPQHRRQPTSAAKGRTLVAAMAVGAAAAAAYTMVTAHQPVITRTVLAAE